MNETNKNLGLAGKLSSFFIKSPLSPLLLFAMMSIGLVGLIFTPRQEDPEIAVTIVDIFVQSPGVSAEQLSAVATEPLELIMSEIEGVKHVYSATQRGGLLVSVQFKVGESKESSIVKVYNKIESNLNKIPPGIGRPLIRPKGIDDVPIVNLTLWSKDVDDSVLRNLANSIVHKLETLPSTGESFVVGGRTTQIKVEVMPEKLSGYGISMDQIAQTIRNANSLRNTGMSESGDNNFTVYSGNFLYGSNDVANLVLGMQMGKPIYMRDVAKVYMGPSEATNFVEFYTGDSYLGENKADGLPAVTIAIAKQKGSNAIPVANAIIKKIETMKGEIIPDNIHVDVTRNYGHTAKVKVNSLLGDLLIATAIVACLIFFALGYRPSLVVSIVIPVILLMTIFWAMMVGYSINRVSLFALIFSIGILVDDAIVVIENIYRRWLQADSRDIATAIDATREVGNPTIIATFTVVAALLPMGFVRELMGPYMAPIPILGSAAMILSLFAAFAFIPWLAYKFRPSKESLEKMEQRETRQAKTINKYYGALLKSIVESKKLGRIVLIGVISLFFVSMYQFYNQSVIAKMLPYDNKSEFEVVVDMPTGTALPVTANVVKQIAEVIMTIPELTAFQTYIGTAHPYNFNGMVRHYYLRNDSAGADIAVQLSEKNVRERSSHEIAMELRNKLQKIAKDNNAKITVAESPPGPPVLQAMVGEVYGDDPEDRRAVATKLTELFQQTSILGDVDNLMNDPHEIIHFKINTEKAMRSGVSVETINRNLTMAMGGAKVGDVKYGRSKEPTYIMLEVPLSIRTNVNSLVELPIPTDDMRGVVALGELGEFVKHQAEDIIYHKDLKPVEYVVADTVNKLPAPLYAINEVHSLMEEVDFKSPVTGKKVETYWFGTPASYSDTIINWDGEWRVTFVTFRDMGMAFAAAIVLIYILVVGQFKNFIIPLVVISPIPLTLIGIVWGHWLLDAEFTATSMIGFIALAGIIVRNSILLVDFAQIELSGGKGLVESVVSSGVVRMRPIFITAITLVGGSSTILFDPIFQGMAVSLLFGVSISTFLTLVIIPLGCISLGDSLYPEGTKAPSGNKPMPPSGGGQKLEKANKLEPKAKQGSRTSEEFAKLVQALRKQKSKPLKETKDVQVTKDALEKDKSEVEENKISAPEVSASDKDSNAKTAITETTQDEVKHANLAKPRIIPHTTSDSEHAQKNAEAQKKPEKETVSDINKALKKQAKKAKKKKEKKAMKEQAKQDTNNGIISTDTRVVRKKIRLKKNLE